MARTPRTVVEIVETSAALSAPERKLLANALREADDARNVMEDALVRFGDVRKRPVRIDVFRIFRQILDKTIKAT